MAIPNVSSCCGCFSVRTGALTILYAQVFLLSVGLVANIPIYPAFIAPSILGLFLTFSCVYGIHRKRTNFMMPLITLESAIVLLCVMMCAFAVLYYIDIPKGDIAQQVVFYTVAFFIWAFGTALLSYFVCILNSLLETIKRENAELNAEENAIPNEHTPLITDAADSTRLNDSWNP